ALAFSRDGRRMASGDYSYGDPGLRVWDATPLTDQDNPGASRVFAGHAGAVNGVAFSRDGSLLASGGEDMTVRVRDAATGEMRLPRRGRSRVKSVAFSLDGIHLAACDYQSFVHVWDTRTGQEVFQRRVSLYDLPELSYSPDGRRLAVVGPGGLLPILDA